MSTRLINAALVFAIAALLSTSYLLDGPADHSADHAQAQDIEAAIKSEAAAQRFDRAARTMCGSENAAWADLGGGVIQCSTKRGQRTVRLAVAVVAP